MEVGLENTVSKSAGSQPIAADALQPRKTLFALLDEWVFGLPPQLIRDWTLAFCAVFAAMQLLPDDLGAREISLQRSGVVNRETSSDGWGLVPTRALSPISKRFEKEAVAPLERARIELEPTAFAGFSDIPGDHWAVQLAAFDSMKPLKAMVHRYQLAGAIGATMIVDGKEVHALLMDVYPNKQQAIRASQELPSGMEQINPWVRSVNSIRAKLK